MLIKPCRSVVPGANPDQSCGSAVAYMDVGEGREQDAEASPARIAARTPFMLGTGAPTERGFSMVGLGCLFFRVIPVLPKPVG